MKTKKVIIYGLTLGLALIIWTVINHSIRVNSPLAIVMTLIFFSIYGLTITAFLRFEKINGFRKQLSHLLIIGAIGIGVLGSGYLINAKLINKSYVANEIEKSYSNWDRLGYTNYEIANQVELTDTFTNPVLWSFEIVKFNTIIFLISLFMILSFKFIRQSLNDNTSLDYMTS
ncbi:MAG: hypothetical protein JXB49_03305 [Bacteroidales bacterium]|nr:hypothetical protein [Bacteroidales bacterium]